MAENIEEEILEFALDQDSIQNLLEICDRKWCKTKQEVLKLVLDYESRDIIYFYEIVPESHHTDPESTRHRRILPEDINLNYLSEKIYTWIAPTDRTVETLNQMYASRKPTLS